MSCMTPELPVVGCPVPGASPSPSPTASPTPAPSPSALPSPAAAPSATPQPVPAEAVVDDSGLLAGPSPAVDAVLVEAPVAAPALPAGPVTAVQTAAPVGVPVSAAGAPLTTVLPGAFALSVFGVVGVALLLSFLSGLRPRGGTMKTLRTRLWAGLATIGAAAVVGGLGWYRISGEPLLNRQVPLLASAGIAVVVLAVLGGALVVAEQLRTDQDRIDELEEAVRTLTETLAPLVEQPARRAESDALLQ